MTLGAQRRRRLLGGLQLGRMTLAVAHGQRIGFKPGGVGHGEDGGGVESAGKQDDGAFGHDRGRGRRGMGVADGESAYFSAPAGRSQSGRADAAHRRASFHGC